ncbi:hypothetical protein WG66_003864 [Moniliophthora roreri]|uniref:Uncharacterized protein n=1 Tax=Moniliophthora roreri TaxID=221103 RepID=A0A0W0FM87_MONRR|nr:hypothetical protein WG66_003864 [Moniliophthora roreri]
MVYFTSSFKFLALVSAVFFLHANAVPLGRRQAECPGLALGLEHTVDAVNDLAALSNDPAVSQAQSALQNAQEGNDVGQGLKTTSEALDSIESNDASVDSAVQDALDELATTQEAFDLCNGASKRNLTKRQIGNLQCNIARLQTVRNLGATTNSVDAIAGAAGSDAATASAASSASDSLASAQDGIGQIAQALLTGQQAPAAARDRVGQGLLDAKSALDGITSTDPKVMSALSDAQASLDKTIAAGQQVVSQCK